MEETTALVVFDSGHTVKVQARSRDILALERAGVNFDAVGQVETSFLAAFAALQRMGRAGQLPDGLELPATAEEFMDIADIEDVEVDQGEASGQVATTG